MTIVYRFRPMRNLIGKYRELEQQELALSSPRYFNDPLEGYQDVFWEGDEVLWENLLRHYLLNLHRAAIICRLSDNDEDLDEYAIDPKLTRDDLPTDDYRQQFNSVCQSFFDEGGFERIPSSLASLPKPLKRKSLQLFLSVIHHSALASVLDTLRNSNMIPETWPKVTNSIDSDTVVEILDGLSAAMDEEAEAPGIEFIASHVGPLGSHTFLQRALETEVDELELHTKKEILLFASFPGRYVRQICDSLIHPNWHTLCFSKECTSPSMWAAYADEHRGAALMFHTDGQSDGSWAELTVNGRTGWQGSEPITGQIQAPLYAVDYESPPPQVDFFQFLGTLPRPKLMSAWHSTPDGDTSPIVDEILEDEDSWRENLWDHFHSMSTTKLEQWKHEQEIRMVLPDLLGVEDSHRKVTYDLSQLAGVVFGLRTSLEDRFEVMRILTESSQDDDSPPVEFYEMVFDGTSFRKVKLAV
ncbi:hypothetical protein ACH9L7_20175 (plasmid) [Haloferax sp. S1W]|uniref:hypothetical protein n=1 Tax=Haloferax sp. S1W TaxID=3377110 RepID=UPI0037C8265D